MEFEEYQRLVVRAADLAESRRLEDLEQAIAIFESLLESDIPDLDKSMMCRNLAVCADMLGRVTEALRWYDEGVRYEQGCEGVGVAASKAVYLVEHGFVDKGLRAHEDLLARPSLTEEERQGIRHNLEVLRQAYSDQS